MSTTANAATTRALLAAGIVVGPLYLILGIAQGLLRAGFDFNRHPLSVLANGPGGWVQTANFVLGGLMVIAAAIGVRRSLGERSGAVVGFLMAYGVSMLAASVFQA